jgi:hypothetical protein
MKNPSLKAKGSEMSTNHALPAIRDKISAIRRLARDEIERGGNPAMEQVLKLADEADVGLWGLIDAADGLPPDTEGEAD